MEREREREREESGEESKREKTGGDQIIGNTPTDGCEPATELCPFGILFRERDRKRKKKNLRRPNQTIYHKRYLVGRSRESSYSAFG